jgi:CO dehydrogenase/acetyl-CoA synthase alpha subunit
MSTEKKVMIKDMKAPGLDLSDVKIEFGDVEEFWDEPMGPTPMPSITDLREWDFKLLKKYPPLYQRINAALVALGRSPSLQERLRWSRYGEQLPTVRTQTTSFTR